jgi:glycosyltransferase involved in cell wall biosynthesis
MRICLIGATHPCHNPRLVREADTLVEAGHQVRVVAPSYWDRLAAKDQRLLSTRSWRLQQVDFCPTGLAGRGRSFLIRGRRRAARTCYSWLGGQRFAELAYTLAFCELKRLAAAEPADWFIAHTQAALPVAASAASRWKAKLGFDCEDLLSQSTSDPVEIVKAIEEAYLRRCDYVSVPSHAMGTKLASLYGVAPIVLSNVFPVRLADGMLPPSKRANHPALRLHWFSQTIGPGRGIEDAVRALGLLGSDIELHLRGSLDDTYRSRLSELASDSGVSARLFFYPQIDHDDLIRTMGNFDIGLALERPDDPNYSLTITNKIYSYMLAGLPIIATETPGHLEALSVIPAASASYPAGDTQALASYIERWRDPSALRDAQQSAWDLARETFCWDQVSQTFLEVLEDGGRGISDAAMKGLSVCAEF